MKMLINYFRQRRERKLRQWCIDKAMHSIAIGGLALRSEAQDIYDWVTTRDVIGEE